MPRESFRSATLTTPRGVAMWAKVTEPDTKFKTEGEYSIKLRLRGADAEKFKSQVDAAIAESQAAFSQELSEAKAKEKNPKKRSEIKDLADPPYIEVYENDLPTGDIEFKFSMKASGVSPKTGKEWARKPLIFDSLGQRLDKPPIVGNGSIVRVSCTTNGWFTAKLGIGVSLRLEAVQIVNLREGYGATDASSFGFAAEEGDFTQPSDHTDTPAEEPTPRAPAKRPREDF